MLKIDLPAFARALLAAPPMPEADISEDVSYLMDLYKKARQEPLFIADIDFDAFEENSLGALDEILDDIGRDVEKINRTHYKMMKNRAKSTHTRHFL